MSISRRKFLGWLGAAGAAGTGVSAGRRADAATTHEFEGYPDAMGVLFDNYHCIGIEMETAAVFRAAELVSVRAAALLQISDVPADRKSLFSGRSEKEQERRRYIRRHVLPRIALEVLTAS